MRYVCLTCDYDGTIARNGKVAQSTLQALTKVKSSGRKLILATGREVDDLIGTFPEVPLFDRVVAENGGVLYRPGSQERIVLAETPPRPFVEELIRRGVEPLSVGQCVVATWHPNETKVLEVIRAMSLELQIIFNKNAVMILPSGVNKETGLKVALKELRISPHNVVGVGDAENDHAFLNLCECRIVVSNALPALKERADWVTAHSHGAGVEELIQLLLQNDLEDLTPRLKRHEIQLGSLENGEPFSLPAYGSRLLIAGASGSGKSTIVTAIVERLVASKYQVCLFDPEGDYDEFEQLPSLGGPDRIPSSSEVFDTLANPSQSLGINLLGVPLADRPSFFQSLLAHVQELRFKTGHPHWVVIDEAHHVLPAEHGAGGAVVPKDLKNFALVTVHPDLVAPAILSSVGGMIVVGKDTQVVVEQFNKGVGKDYRMDPSMNNPPESGYVLCWIFADPAGPRYVKVKLPESHRRRHRRKYAAGELGEDKSFYFRGPDGKLNLRAQNMNLFAQLAEGLDDETWSFHLAQADYSRWLRETIRDEDLAEVVGSVEKDASLGAKESRQRIVEAIRKHYTAPA
jgi:hydroxymethylpyrimidine pyrophosphatase-like HAD family hydrolase